ncbi:MAG: DUF924 family protein [Myxococcota bacterium]
MSTTAKIGERAGEILEYWFGSLRDDSKLEQQVEPFQTCYARWYGKREAIDAEIRTRFERDLLDVTSAGASWFDTVDAWEAAPNGLLALTILLDQFPRNMYRNTTRMYDCDPLALMVASRAIRDKRYAELPLVHQMFLRVPFMHIENLTIQQFMLGQFKTLAEQSETRSPHNVQFFRFALRFAERHLEVIQKYGRFPHRNVILGRTPTPQELEYMQGDDPGF